MRLHIDAPPDYMLIDLAPRVEGRRDYRGEYGYALALTSESKIRVTWDDGGVDDVEPEDVLFLHFGNRP